MTARVPYNATSGPHTCMNARVPYATVVPHTRRLREYHAVSVPHSPTCTRPHALSAPHTLPQRLSSHSSEKATSGPDTRVASAEAHAVSGTLRHKRACACTWRAPQISPLSARAAWVLSSFALLRGLTRQNIRRQSSWKPLFCCQFQISHRAKGKSWADQVAERENTLGAASPSVLDIA